MRTLLFLMIILYCFGAHSQSNRTSRYGLKIPTQEFIDSLPTLVFKPKRRKTINTVIDLSKHIPIPGDQGPKQGSCVAWAIGYGLKSYQERIEENDNNLVFSPSFIYNQVKDRFANCDDGILYEDALNYLRIYGICKWKEMPYDENYCRSKPSYRAVRNAKKYKIEDWKPIYVSNSTPINTIEKVKFHISEGKPVAIAVWLDSEIAAFMDDLTPDKDKFVWKNPLMNTEKSDFYHAMLAVGYDDNSREFKILNSYGPNSGNNGYIYMSYNAFRKSVYEAYYTLDSDNRGRYVYAKRSKKQLPHFGINDKSFNYYGWVKEGYFIQINEDIKLSCVYLKKSKDEVILKLYDTSNSKEKIIGAYKFNSGDTYITENNGVMYELKLDKISPAGLNIFKPAAFINFSTN